MYISLLLSVDENNLDKVKKDCNYCLNHGIDIDFKDDGVIGNTALHNAVKNDYLEIAKYLIEFGSNINAENNYDETPLFYVKSEKMLKYLVENGADIEHKDDRNQNVIQYLKEKNDSTNLRMFEKYLINSDVSNLKNIDYIQTKKQHSFKI